MRDVVSSRKPEMIWTASWIVFSLALYVMSSGEPVCDGPLITQVNDSFPPECPPPAAALPILFFAYLVGLTAILAVRAVRRGTS